MAITLCASVALIPSALGAKAPTVAEPAATSRKWTNPTIVERAWIATQLYATVGRYFAHWEGLAPGYDWDSRFHAYLSEALTAPDRRAFTLATQRLVASLANGHTDFGDDALRDEPPLPFYARPLEGRWTVTVSRMAGLAPGDVITAIDGMRVDDWLRPTRAVVGESNARGVDRAAFLRPQAMPQRFTLTLNTGRKVVVDRNIAVGEPSPPAKPMEVGVEQRADGTVIIRIPSFDDPKLEAAAIAAVQSHRQAPLILFDVRNNGGGNTPADLLATIMTRPYAGTIVHTPMTIAQFAADGVFDPDYDPAPSPVLRYGPVVTQPLPDAVTTPMAILADGGCASACEDFAIRFRSGQRGPILGETTFGSTGQPYVVTWPKLGFRLRVSTKREFFADGKPFEGVGVVPDIPIPLSSADLRAAGDPQLERALAALHAASRQDAK